MSKYEPLTVFLQQATVSNIRLSFAEIEEIIGAPLPASKQYPAWWSNSATNNTMTKAWLSAGYKTEQLDVDGEKVTFHSDAPSDPPPTAADSIPRSPLFGSMKGRPFWPRVSISPRLQWSFWIPTGIGNMKAMTRGT